MSLDLTVPNVEDAAEIAKVICEAHSAGLMGRRLLREAPSLEIGTQEWIGMVTQKYQTTWNDAQRHVIKDSATGKIVGALSYEIVPTTSLEDLVLKPEESKADATTSSLDTSVFTEGQEIDRNFRVSLMGTQPFLYIKSLSTLPTYQQRGIASKLLKVVLNDAVARKLPIFLTATPAGKPLYLRHGFRLMGQESIDMSSIGEAPYEICAMLLQNPSQGSE